MAVTRQQLMTAGTKDKEYTALMDIIKKGSQISLEEFIPLLHPHFKLKDHFSVMYQDDLEIIMYHDSNLRTRMVIPRSLQDRVKNILHADY